MAVDAAAALRKLQSGQTLTQAERDELKLGAATPAAPKTISQMTKAEIDAATAAQVAAGAKSTSISSQLPGETSSQANARITAGYKEMLAKPVLTQEQIDAGVDVRFVRTELGGVGSYTAQTPIGYTGPAVTATQWTAGIIPSNSPYISGTTLGVMSTGNGTYTTIGGTSPITKTSTGAVETGRVTNADGSITVFYSDNTTKVIPKSTTVVTNNGNGGNGNGNGNGNAGGGDTGAVTTNIDVLKSILRGSGYSAKLVDASASFLQSLLKDNIDYDNAVEIFLNSKEYTLKNGTKITSPFYTDYGYLNESSPKPLKADELYGLVEGAKIIVSKYNLNGKFASPEYLKQYVANQVTIDDLEGRVSLARLKALESDTAYTDALKKLGFISGPEGLTDFFLDPKVGQETLMQNQRMGVFAAEAVRRANFGISVNPELAKRMAAGYTAKGLSEAQIAASASEGYANIADVLQPLTKLSGIYEGPKATQQAGIQTELEQEEFMGMESARRKRLKETETRAFQAESGTSQYSLRGPGLAGLI